MTRWNGRVVGTARVCGCRSLAFALPLLVIVVPKCVTAQHQEYQSGPLPKEGSPFTGLAPAPEANLFLGAATTTLPIQVPPGRHQITPALALAYTSSGGPSVYGYGWDLALGRIQRSTTHGVLTCADPSHVEHFILNLPGNAVEFVRNAAGQGIPRVQESFLKIQHNSGPNSWTVWDRSGIKYVFGESAASRTGNIVSSLYESTSCPADSYGPRYTFAWNLTSVEDTNGNRLDIEYQWVDGVSFPERILYGGSINGFGHQFEVDFVWAVRPLGEELANGIGGFTARLRRMLDRIDIRHPVGGPLVRRYRLDYETEIGPARIGRQIFLTAVTLYNGNDQALARYDGLPASTTFLYHEHSTLQRGFGAAQNAPKPPPPPGVVLTHGRHSNSETTRTTRDIFDITGDGIPDWIITPAPSVCPLNDPFWYVYPGTGAGFETVPIIWDAPACVIRDGTSSGNPINTYSTKDTLDLNGDSIPDFIDTTAWTPSSPRWNVYFGQVVASGGGFASTAFAWPSPLKELRYTVAGEVSGYGYSAAPGSVDIRDLVDMNDDGLPDLVQVGSPTGDWTVWINTGSAFATSRVFPVGLTGSPLRWTRQRDEIIAVRDMNGDGLPDHLLTGFGNVTWPGYWFVYVNTGHGTELEEHWTLPSALGGQHMRRMSDDFEEIVRNVVDINGDGLPDVVDQTGWSTSSPYWRVVLNRGESFSQTVLSWQSPLPLLRDGGDEGHTHKDTFDIDGDGLIDHVDFTSASAVTIYRNAGGAWCTSSNGLTCGSAGAAGVAPNPAGLRPDLLVRFENGIGGTTTLEYRPSTQWDNTGGDDVSDLPLNVWTITRLQRDDGMCDDDGAHCVNPGGHTLVTNLGYLNGRLDAVERTFRGFQVVTTRDADSTSTPHQGRSTYFHQAAALVGKIQDQYVYDASLGLAFGILSRTSTTWECANPTTGTVIACPALPNGNVWIRRKRTESFTYSNFSPITYKRATSETHSWHLCGGKFYGNAAHSSDGDPSGSPRQQSHAEYACLDTGSAYIVDKPTHVWTNISNDGTMLEEKWFFYDQQTIGALTKGNLTREERWLNSWTTPATSCSVGTKSCVKTSMFYDAFGNLTLVTDALGRQTQTQYDSATQIYPFIVTGAVPFQQRSATQYNPACGALLWQSITYTGVTIPSQRHQRQYDPFCRLRQTALPDEDIINAPHQLFEYAIGGPQYPSHVRVWTKEPTAVAGYRLAQTSTDAFGRVIQQARSSNVAGSAGYVATVNSYDSRGNNEQQSAPFVTAALATYTAPPSGAGVTTFAYDTLNRVTAVTRPDGSVQAVDHSVAWQTAAADECYTAPNCTGGRTLELRDALGRLIERRVYEEDTLKSRTVHTYDELGHLLTTRQGATEAGALNENTLIVVSYDSLGRKVQTIDPDSGTWRYGYDPVGNMKYQDDPKSNQHVQFCYDNLNRITLECPLSTDYSGTNVSCSASSCGMEEVRSFYDSPQVSFGLGRLTRVTDASGETRFDAFDVRGRPLQVTKEVDAHGDGQNVTTATTEYAYDAADHLKELVYPDGELVRYHYDPAGQLMRLSSVTHNVDYVSNLTYDVFGRPLNLDHGNGTKDTLAYGGPNTNYRLATLSTYAGINVRLLYNFPSYTPTGLLKQIVDSGPKGAGNVLDNSATFAYDGLGRLTQASGAQLGTFTYQYDYLGNLTVKEGSTFTYLSAKPHTLWRINGSATGIGHDANGNRLGKPSQTYAYDSRDRLTSINNDQVRFRYDYTGRRVVKVKGDDTLTVYYSDLFESSGGWITKYYFAGTRLVATRRAQSADFAAVHEPPVQLAATSLVHPAIVLVVRRDVQTGLAVAALLLTSALIVHPVRRRRTVGIRIRHGHVIGVTAAFALSSFPWPLWVRMADAQCIPPPQLVFHYHADHLGSTQLVTNSTGGVVQYVRYRPYGEVRGRFNGSGAPVSPSEVHRYEFTKYESDFFSGLQYAGARFYDPALGTFLTHDPVRQFASPYAYGPWSPLNGTDPNGAFWPALIALIKVVLVSAAVSASINVVIAAAQGADPGDLGQSALTGAITGAVGVGIGVLASAISIGLASLASTLPADVTVDSALNALGEVAVRSALSTASANLAGRTVEAAGAPSWGVSAASFTGGYLGSLAFDQLLLDASGDLAAIEGKGIFRPVSNSVTHTDVTLAAANDVGFSTSESNQIVAANLGQDSTPWDNASHFGLGARKAVQDFWGRASAFFRQGRHDDFLSEIGRATHHIQDQYALGHIFPGTHLLGGMPGAPFRFLIHQTVGGEVNFFNVIGNARIPSSFNGTREFLSVAASYTGA